VLKSLFENPESLVPFLLFPPFGYCDYPSSSKLLAMLRRRTGLYLLTLLVITGLAGTINDNSLSKPERKFATVLMKDTYKDAVAATKGLSDAQLNFKAAPDRWSMKECMYHIAAAEKLLWTVFETTIKAPANPEKRSEIKVTDDQVVKMVEDRSKKFQAPEPIQPKNTGFKTLDEALADFKNSRMSHIKYMKTSTEDLRNHVAQLPVGWIDCYQLYLFIAAHSNRHTQQMNEVKADAAFPAK
jgi:DinB superfamily